LTPFIRDDISLFIIHPPETLLLKNFIFKPMHLFRFFHPEVIEAEVMQQTVCNIKGQLGYRGMTSQTGLRFGPFAVYHQLKQSGAAFTFRQIESQAIGSVFMVQEFSVKFANMIIADYGDTDRRIGKTKTITDYADKLDERAPCQADIFIIASDVDSYALHRGISLYWSCSGGISGGVGYAIRP
jgi:hypothetical protein